MIQRHPDNFLILSGVLSYLYQSVVSTPVKVHTFVRRALAELLYGNVVARFGMFFLHNLDVTLEESIFPELSAVDDFKIRSTFNLPAKSKKKMVHTNDSASGGRSR